MIELPVSPRTVGLFLDIDGTMLDIAPVPEAVVVPPTLVETLRDLGRGLDGAVAFVTGRQMEEIDRLFAPLRFPAAGEHGAVVRLGNSETTMVDRSATFAPIRAAAEAFVSSRPGLMVEPKQHGVAVHYRLSPVRGHEVRRFLADLLANQTEPLELMAGKMVWEVRLRGVSKATAIDALMCCPPFAGRYPVFAGDDRTDEDGFAEVARRGGTVIRVGDGPLPERGLRIASPQALRAWLADFAAELLGTTADVPG